MVPVFFAEQKQGSRVASIHAIMRYFEIDQSPYSGLIRLGALDGVIPTHQISR